MISNKIDIVLFNSFFIMNSDNQDQFIYLPQSEKMINRAMIAKVIPDKSYDAHGFFLHLKDGEKIKIGKTDYKTLRQKLKCL